MSSDAAPNALYLALLLVLIGSSLIARRLPLGQSMRMAAAWVGIFAAAVVLFAFRGEFSALWQKLRAEVSGQPEVRGQELRIPMSEDGHFWVTASVDGEEVRFLVDSGASITTVSRATADRLGLQTGMRVEQVETANGIVPMRKSRAGRLAVGPIERSEMGVNVNDADGADVLGMNFLSSLSRWSVEGQTLVLVS